MMDCFDSAMKGGWVCLLEEAMPSVASSASLFPSSVESATFANGGGDTGNGTCGTITTAYPGLIAGAYTFTAVDATHFTGVDPNGGAIAPLVVGTVYNLVVNGITVLSFTITAGGTAYVANDTFTITINNFPTIRNAQLALLTVRTAKISARFDGGVATTANGSDYAVSATVPGYPHVFPMDVEHLAKVKAIQSGGTATGWISYWSPATQNPTL